MLRPETKESSSIPRFPSHPTSSAHSLASASTLCSESDHFSGALCCKDGLSHHPVAPGQRQHHSNWSTCFHSCPTPAPPSTKHPLFCLHFKSHPITPHRGVPTAPRMKFKFPPCSARPHVTCPLPACPASAPQVCTPATPTWFPPEGLRSCFPQLRTLSPWLSVGCILHIPQGSTKTSPQSPFPDHSC